MLDLKEVERIYIQRTKQKLPSILIFGPPGAGKGTLSKRLAETLNLCHLSTGDVFRGLSKETELGRRVAEVASEGHYITDDVTIFIWRQYVNGLIATNAYLPESQFLLLDGIPRTIGQAKGIADHIDVKCILKLEMKDEEELIRRLKGRAKEEGRADDGDEEILRRRQRIYHEKTAQILEFYPESLVVPINADQPVERVLEDALKALKKSVPSLVEKGAQNL